MNRFAPGPKGNFLLGCFKEFRDTPLELLTNCQRQFGDVVQLPLGLGFSCGLVFNPTDIDKVFHSQEFGRSDFAAEFEPLAGGSMIIADGDQWKTQRKSVIPSFALPRLKSMASRINEAAEKEVSSWLPVSDNSGTVDIQDCMVRYAMSVLSQFLFGQELSKADSSVIAEWWTTSLTCMNVRLSQPVPIPYWVPTANTLLLKKSAGRIEQVLRKLIQRSRLLKCGSFVDDLLEHKDEETGKKLSEDQVVREVMGVFLAGFDTVASGMMWTLYELSRNTSWQDSVRTELSTSSPEEFDMKRLPILHGVFQESARLWPSLWIVDRKALSETNLGNIRVPAGTNILTSPWVTHRDPKYWPDPQKFNPERFIQNTDPERLKYSYFPFGGGRMKCIGIGLTYLELAALFRHALNKFEFTYDEANPFYIEPAFVLRTKQGLLVKVKRRGVNLRNAASLTA